MLGTQVHFVFAAITSPAILFKAYHFGAIYNTLCLRTARTSVTRLHYLAIGLLSSNLVIRRLFQQIKFKASHNGPAGTK